MAADPGQVQPCGCVRRAQRRVHAHAQRLAVPVTGRRRESLLFRSKLSRHAPCAMITTSDYPPFLPGCHSGVHGAR
eukprot:2911208-Prymnesium_polylepis.1